MKKNGSIYIHTYLVKWDKPKESLKQLLSPTDRTVVHSVKRLNKFKKRFFTQTQNLLTGETASSKEDIEVRKSDSRNSIRAFYKFCVNVHVLKISESQTHEFGDSISLASEPNHIIGDRSHGLDVRSGAGPYKRMYLKTF